MKADCWFPPNHPAAGLKLRPTGSDALVRMTISGQSPVSLLESVLDAQSARVTTDVALLKKSQDLMKQQGQAMIEMLEQAGTVDPTRRLDAYA